MSSRLFSKISPAIWRPGRFTALPTVKAKLLHLYFLTCEHQTSAGCFRLPDGYACADLGWTVEEYRAERQKLIDAGLIAFDASTSEIYVERWFKHNVPATEKHKQGARRLIEAIESDEIHEKAEADFAAVAGAQISMNPLDPPRQPDTRLTGTAYMRRGQV
jgi:hypothetical protein